MRSEWKVTSNFIGDSKMYAVYRLRNIAKTDNSGNREFATEYMGDRQEAIESAKKLNAAAVTNGRSSALATAELLAHCAGS